MLFLVSLLLGCNGIFGKPLPSPRSLHVNYRATHEDADSSERRHLPIVEVFKTASNIQLPIFSWTLYDDSHSNRYNISQIYYEIELYHEHQTERYLIWKSDKILSNKHFCNLNHLKQHELKQIFEHFKWNILSFRIRSTYDENQNMFTEWSNFARFVVTSGMNADWNNASYIAQSTDTAHNIAAPRFIKTFSLKPDKKITSAVINLVGLGFFRLILNDNDVLSLHSPPIYQIGGWTNTKHRVPYAAFDVTPYLSTSNSNIIMVDLGEGYRNMTAYPPKDQDDYDNIFTTKYDGISRYNRSTDDPIDCILKLQLYVVYTDGTHDIIVTDRSWQTVTTAITLSSIYNGETYDETADIVQGSVQTVIGPTGILSPTVQPYVSINNIIKPLDTIYSLSNSQIVDFGENNAGVVRINVGGLDLGKGDQINMKFAEIKLHPPYGPINGSLYYGNLRTAQQYDTFISDGNSTGFWTPRFTIHGFRYMEVWGYPRTLTVNDVEKLVIYANVAKRANWSSSDKVLNTVNQRCINGQLSNLKSVLTDCNQRDERLGWMGDAALSSDTLAINFDMRSFFVNLLELMTDEQGTDGSLPDVVPFYRYGGTQSDPNWEIAYPQCISVLYQYYGTSFMDIIKQYMDAPAYNLPLYIEALQSRMPKNSITGKDDITKYHASYGDWVPPPPSPKVSNNFAGAFGYIDTVRIIKKLSKIIGNTSYEEYLDSLQSNLTEEFIAGFYNDTQYLNGLQSSYAMALHSELYSNDTMKTSLQNNLLKQIHIDNNLLTTGIIGAKFILPVLSDMNQENLALNLIKGREGVYNESNGSYPSWAYEQEVNVEPATAIWELWNAPEEGPGMNSRNHHMYSSVSGFLNTDISGIKSKVYLHNHLDIMIGHLLYDELRWSLFESDNGLIRYNWKWETQKHLILDIIVPIGHFGHLNFKLKNNCKIIEGGVTKSVWNLFGGDIMDKSHFRKRYDAKFDDKGMVVIGSGHYEWYIFCV